MCVCVHKCACVFVDMCSMHLCVYMYLYTCIYVCWCIFVCIQVCVFVHCLYVFMCTCTYTRVYACWYVYMCVHCIYMYPCSHVSVYCVYLHACVHTCAHSACVTRIHMFMCACMRCICACVGYVYVSMYVYTCLHLNVHVLHTHLRAFACVRVYMHAHMCARLCTQVHIRVTSEVTSQFTMDSSGIWPPNLVLYTWLHTDVTTPATLILTVSSTYPSDSNYLPEEQTLNVSRYVSNPVTTRPLRSLTVTSKAEWSECPDLYTEPCSASPRLALRCHTSEHMEFQPGSRTQKPLHSTSDKRYFQW